MFSLKRDIRESNLLDSSRALFHTTRLSEAEYDKLSREYVASTKLLKEMKSDLDYIFEKI